MRMREGGTDAMREKMPSHSSSDLAQMLEA